MITLVADADREAHVRFIPGADLVAGHVIDFFGEQHRVDRFVVEQRGPLFDPERFPPRRIAVGTTDWSLTILPDQMVPVLYPTTLYTLDVFLTRSPHQPVERVPFAAETSEQAEVTARRILILLGARWGDIQVDGVDVATVTLAGGTR